LLVMTWFLLLLVAAGTLAAQAPAPTPPDVLLVTMDTTRADAVGFSGAVDARTPVLDRLAALGVRYRTAISPAPLTLPSHATILTGLDPPEHGVRSNGAEALARGVPTLASVLTEAGWTTGAFVASRVLDHRFGLDHGFATYDDAMLAERIGEYGYPERDARAVTDTAVEWLGDRKTNAPFFLWVHYYDPHAPYIPPAGFGGATERAAYLGEVTFVDEQIGRLIRALPRDLAKTIVMVVGDHGEALGDHGEQTHGIFLYRAVLEVPLIVVASSLPAGQAVDEAVALRQVAPTVLRMVDLRDNVIARKDPLPLPNRESGSRRPIYAEATMPESAYGWAPLQAVVMGGLKYIAAPRPELYDLEADPAESRNLVATHPGDTQRLAALLEELASGWAETAPAPAPEIDGEIRAALRSLGYVGEDGVGESDSIDPKDGMELLAELEVATQLLRAGEIEAAVRRLAVLVGRNPANAPLQTRYGEALLATGEDERAIKAYRAAVDLRPSSEFARKNLGDALLELGRTNEARSAYLEALGINPRWAPVWLRLADLESDEDRLAVLRRAVGAGAESITVLLRLAEIELETDPDAALEICRNIGELEPVAAEGALCLGRAYLALDEPLRAAPHLRRAAVLGRGTVVGESAAELLRDEAPR
jgi:choline-sulfatase